MNRIAQAVMEFLMVRKRKFSMLRNSRAQAAMEFLMTYGWAILVVLIAIGALAYFGILSPSAFFPEKCTLESGMACTDLVIGEDGVQVQLTNGFGNDITVTEVRVISAELGVNCYNTNDLLVKNGAAADFTIPACNLTAIGDGKKKYELEVKYTKQGSSFVHTMDGEVLAEVEDEYFFVPGKALSFDGVADLVDAGSGPSLTLTNKATLEAWIYQTGYGLDYPSPLGKNQFRIYHNPGATDMNVYAMVSGVGHWPVFTSNNPLYEWHHLVVTFDGDLASSNLKLYYDSVLVVSEDAMGTLDGSAEVVKIGGGNGATSFDGLIDEVRVYNRAITPEEVTEHYNKGVGNFGGPEPGLVLGYHFDDGADPTADFSGNGNDGGLIFSPTYVEGLVDKP